LSSALVDAIVDVDLTDIVSFSVAGLMFVEFEVVVVQDKMCCAMASEWWSGISILG
jgi:hypothetical protein